MTRGRWLLIGGIAIVVVSAAFLATWILPTPTGALDPGASSESSAALATTPATPAAVKSTSSPDATPTTVPTETVSPTPRPTPTADPTAASTPTDPPVAHGDARLLYAEFLLRVNDDRTTVERLNASLTDAAQGQDPGAVRAASVDILDFVDSERDWLREHPPASCYAKAHKAARTMVADYGTAAERFLDWAGTGGGLAGLQALSSALDAADTAGDALAAFGRALEATTCPH